MSELMNYSNEHVSLQDKVAYAERLAGASLLPAAYKKQPANVLLAMEMGDAMGIPPIQAINEIHVIEGKPSASANLIGAMVRRAGHKLRVQGDDQSATAQIIRADDPDFTFEVTWTLERAKQAGLMSGKNNWAKYPAAMLKARAITEVARAATPDALYGVIYTPEELGATVNEDGTPVEPVSVPNTMPPQNNGGGSRISQAQQRTQARQPQQEQAPSITQEQWNQIDQQLQALGIVGPQQPKAIGDILDRPIQHPSAILATEFDTLMAVLTEGTAEGTVEDAEIIEETNNAGQAEADQAQEALENFVNG